MTKLLIASVSVLALSAGAAFAGSNSSDVEQIGAAISATVDQTIGSVARTAQPSIRVTLETATRLIIGVLL